MKHLQVLLLAFLRFFPRGTYGLLQGYCVLAERKQPDFSGSVRFYSELMLIPGDPKKRFVALQLKYGLLEVRWLAEFWLKCSSQ